MTEPSPDITGRINGILDYLEVAIKTTGDFAVEQTPLVVEELLRWEFAISLIGFLFGVVLSIALLSMGIMAIKLEWGERSSREGEWIMHPMAVASLMQMAQVFPAIFIGTNFEWLQIWLAPRVFLLEYATNLLP